MVEKPNIRQHLDKHHKRSETCPESNEHCRNPFSLHTPLMGLVPHDPHHARPASPAGAGPSGRRPAGHPRPGHSHSESSPRGSGVRRDTASPAPLKRRDQSVTTVVHYPQDTLPKHSPEDEQTVLKEEGRGRKIF